MYVLVNKICLNQTVVMSCECLLLSTIIWIECTWTKYELTTIYRLAKNAMLWILFQDWVILKYINVLWRISEYFVGKTNRGRTIIQVRWMGAHHCMLIEINELSEITDTASSENGRQMNIVNVIMMKTVCTTQ